MLKHVQRSSFRDIWRPNSHDFLIYCSKRNQFIKENSMKTKDIVSHLECSRNLSVQFFIAKYPRALQAGSFQQIEEKINKISSNLIYRTNSNVFILVNIQSKESDRWMNNFKGEYFKFTYSMCVFVWNWLKIFSIAESKRFESSK